MLLSHWFYEDYIRPLNPLLPSYSQRHFTHLIIASSPLYTNLGAKDYDGVWEEYCRYKRMVPCCGGILINKQGDKVGSDRWVWWDELMGSSLAALDGIVLDGERMEE